MKLLSPALCCLLLASSAHAQKPETFDISTFTPPKGWYRYPAPAVVQFIVEKEIGGCSIAVFKTLPASTDSKANFATAWKAFVTTPLKATDPPKMQPAFDQNGWTVEQGLASYEAKGKTGTALLLTATAGSQMANVLITTSTDAYQSDIAAFLKSFRLARPTGKAPAAPTKPAPAKTGKFQFTTTNFDDGWTATEQSDWVKVTKGNLVTLVHYPNQKADAYNSDLKAGLQNAWNLLVAPRYTDIQNFALKPIQSFESIAFAEADATEKATGKPVHIVLFKKHFSKGNGRYIEFLAPSKSAFEQVFGPYRSDEFGWEALANMQGKNRFAVSAGDLVGKWSTQDYASLTYYYVNDGGYAGATATSTADLFTFAKGGTYQSDHSGASGRVGAQKFSRQVYKGKYTTNTWTMTLTNRFKGASEKYNCYFEAVKGGRILMLTDRQNTTLSLGKR
ncbi:MAG: hypothetical protein QM758_06105 [Armatimonas sp.]